MKTKSSILIAYCIIVAASVCLVPILSASLDSKVVSARQLPKGDYTVAEHLQQESQEQLGMWEGVPVPVKYTVSSADLVSADDGWAVGAEKIIRWDGKTWIAYDNPIQWRLNGVKLLSHDNGWAVGANQTLLHWDGQSWKAVLSPTPKFYDLFAVTFLSPTLGWAVGGGGDLDRNIAPDGLILKWDGEKWLKVSSPGHYRLHALAFSSETDGWAVGEVNEILHWDGQSWQAYAIPGLDDFFYYSIAMSTSDDGWIAGWRLSQNKFGRYTQEGILLHWDGTEWSEYKRFDYGLFSISMVTSDFGWAVGGNTYDSNGGSLLLHWDGKAWTELPSPTTLPLHFVWVRDTQDGWLFAGGDNINSGFEGAVFRYVIEPTATPTASATASAIPTNAPTATATHIPAPPPSPVPIATPTNAPLTKVNNLPQSIVAWLFATGLLIVIAGGAVFILRRRGKA